VAKANGRGQVRWFEAAESALLSHDAPGEFVSANGA
jgi:hypothetical protein